MEDFIDLKKENDFLRHELERVRADFSNISASFEQAERVRDQNDREHELQHLYNRLFLENCPDAIYVLNRDFKYVLGSNKAEKELFQKSAEQLSGMHFEDACRGAISAKWAETVLARFRHVMVNKCNTQYTEKILHRNAEMYINTLVAPVANSKGECMGVVVVHHNITELNEAKEKAEASAKAKSKFLTQMSHEIRTPMNAVLGMADLLLLSQLSPLDSAHVANIKKASVSLLDIINDILDFSKIETSHMDIANESYDLFSVLTDVANVVNFHATEKKLELFIDIDPRVPGQLCGDGRRIKQILSKLLNNAVKFTSVGCIKLSLNVEKREGEDITLVFSVEDTGEGMKEQDIPNIFEAFQRFGEGAGDGRPGTGLGLSIIKRLVELMGGTLSVSSIYGKGSTFSFYLPQKIVDQTPLAALLNSGSVNFAFCTDNKRLGENVSLIAGRLGTKTQILPALKKDNRIPDLSSFTHVLIDCSSGKNLQEIPHRENQRVSILTGPENMGGLVTNFSGTIIFKPLMVRALANMLNDKGAQNRNFAAEHVRTMIFPTQGVRILVVDDNETNLKVASHILKEFGIEVETADSGLLALGCVAKREYDLIFMDHMMPGMNGADATRAIRKMGGNYEKMPIVALSANVLAEARKEFVSAGMDDFLSKPIELDKISSILKKWLPPEKIVVKNQPEQASVKTAGAVLASGYSVEELREKLVFIEEIDVTNGLSHTLNNPATYIVVLKACNSQLLKKIPFLVELQAQKDYVRLKIEVHGLKSALANVGVCGLSEEAQNIEFDMINEDINSAVAKMPQFIAGLEQLSDKLQELFASKPERAVVRSSDNKTQYDLKHLLQSVQNNALAERYEEIQAMIGDINTYPGDTVRSFVKTASLLLENRNFDQLEKLVAKTLEKIGQESGRKYTVFIVDDDITNLKLLQKILGETYKAVPISSGRQALKLLGAKNPDLILLDIEMPEMDGFQFLEQLKSKADYREIPVIFLTGMQGYEREIKCLEMGAVDYIHKPVQPQLVLTRIKTHLELHAYRRHLSQLVDEKTATILKLQEVTIGMLATATEYRDGSTGEHIMRTKELVGIIASNIPEKAGQEYYLDEEKKKNIIKASQLHDIGKAAIPDSILLKPGKLTDGEWVIMRSHTVKGAELLDEALSELDSDSMLDVARDIAVYHHEKWDGTGYPYALGGKEIPLSARIMAIADVYDALVSKRPYKEPMGKEEASRIIVEGRGTHFDPVLIDVFEKIYDQLPGETKEAIV